MELYAQCRYECESMPFKDPVKQKKHNVNGI